MELAVQRAHAVAESGEPGPLDEGGAADAVVLDLDREPAVVRPTHRHAGPGRPRVLRDVGERLTDDEVGGRLNRGGRPLGDLDANLDRYEGSGGEGGQGDVEPSVGEHRGVDPAREVANLRDRLLGLLVRLVDERLRAIGVGVELLLRSAEVHRERDEPLLHAVLSPGDHDRLPVGVLLAAGPAGPGEAPDVEDPRPPVVQEASPRRSLTSSDQPSASIWSASFGVRRSNRALPALHTTIAVRSRARSISAVATHAVFEPC